MLRNDNFYPTDMPKAKINREFCCFTCKEEKMRNQMKFTTIDKLYDHWYSKHMENNAPFRFYSADLLLCNVCRYFSTFYSLQKHHKMKHPNENFVPVQNRRCALCLYDENNLKAHVCKELQKVQQLKVFNPIVYTEEATTELEELNTKFECKHCHGLFDSSQDVMRHHHEDHKYEFQFNMHVFSSN